MSVYDFPDLLPEDQEDEPEFTDSAGIGSAVLALTDFVEDEPDEAIAISQQGYIVGVDLASGPDFTYPPDPIPENSMSAEDAVIQLIRLKEYCRADSGGEWDRITAALDLAIKILEEGQH